VTLAALALITLVVLSVTLVAELIGMREGEPA
jgi:hypothetical protein